MLRLTPAVLALVLAHPALAQEEPEIVGVILDSTITRFGHDFHRHLSERLREAGDIDFDLVVRERPSASWGSLIWVEHEQQVVYRRFLRPGSAYIGDVATVAADEVLEAVNRSRLQSLLQDTFNLERRNEL